MISKERCEASVQAGRRVLPELLRDPGYAVLAEPRMVDGLAVAYAQSPSPELRERILKLGGVQATSALTRLRLAGVGLCPADRAPRLPAKVLADWGTKFAAWARVEIAAALVNTPSAYRNDLEVSGAPWPAIEGAWGMTSLMSRFGGAAAISEAREWLNRHKDCPPIIAPFDCLDWALCEFAIGAPLETAQSPSGLSGRSMFASVEVAAARKCHDWAVAQQSQSGGWAQFDKDQSLTAIASTPLAGEADIPCPGITGRVLEWLAPSLAPAVTKPALTFLEQSQLLDGCWQSVWGRGRINGTYSALAGFAATGKGEFDNEAYVLRGGEWLRSIQNADGGWGEDIHTANPVQASTATHTAWAVLGLIAGADLTSSSLHSGVRCLLGMQAPTGGWTDEAPTIGGPGFEFLGNSFYPTVYATLAVNRYIEAVLNRG